MKNDKLYVGSSRLSDVLMKRSILLFVIATTIASSALIVHSKTVPMTTPKIQTAHLNSQIALSQKQSTYYRIQLKSNNQYLDAKYCSTELSLNPGPGYKNGLCQLWRLVPESKGVE